MSSLEPPARPTMSDRDWWQLRQVIEEELARPREGLQALIGDGLRAALAYMTGAESTEP